MAGSKAIQQRHAASAVVARADPDPRERPRAGAPADVRTSAAGAGLPVAGAYWPCLLRWLRHDTTGRVLDGLRTAAGRWDSRSLVTAVSRTTQLLLLAEEPLRRAPRAQLGATVARIAHAGGGEHLTGGFCAVIGDRVGPDERLEPIVRSLRRASAREPAEGGREVVVWARHEALLRLVDHLDAHSAAQFVDDQVGRLATYDRQHGTSLERVLELALDHEDRNAAARAAFMHRNTFRRQLRKALELLDVDLECPEERLAVHLALKMLGREPAGSHGWCAVHRRD